MCPIAPGVWKGVLCPVDGDAWQKTRHTPQPPTKRNLTQVDNVNIGYPTNYSRNSCRAQAMRVGQTASMVTDPLALDRHILHANIGFDQPARCDSNDVWQECPETNELQWPHGCWTRRSYVVPSRRGMLATRGNVNVVVFLLWTLRRILCHTNMPFSVRMARGLHLTNGLGTLWSSRLHDNCANLRH